MSTVVDQHCAAIREQGATISIQQLKTSFDAFVSELKKGGTFSVDITVIKQIVSILVNLPHKSKQLAEPQLIAHHFLTILRDCILVDQLCHRQSKDTAHDLLTDVSILFANVCRYINDTNLYLIKQLLIHKPLINELASCFEEMSISGKHLDDPRLLSSINFLLTAFQRFEKKEIETNECSLTTPLFLAVLKLVCSSYAVDMLTRLEHNFSQKLTEGQTLLLNTCPLYVYWFSGNRKPELALQVTRWLLRPFTAWMTSCHPDSIIYCSQELGDMMRHLAFTLVRPIEWENANGSSEEFYDDYCKRVSHWSSFLPVIIRHSSDEWSGMSIARFIVQDLYNFTLHPSVLNFMKSIPTLRSMLLKMTDVQQSETQLNAYRCLGKLMTEEDIKTMANPSKIAMIYVKFLMNDIDDPKTKERFYSLLQSLKNWVQHDQVKVHLINQKALPLLVRCVTETKFDPIKEQAAALEILLALSFNNDAASALRQNHHFMTHVRSVSNSIISDQSRLQRAAGGLLWKLEKETEAVAKPAILNSYQHDIMMSYSHSDKQLCYQIHEQLVKVGFRVWIDRDHMHGATMIAMADAIENSDIVIICMSDAYKQSVYCQSEAHYAFERRRCLIPLIMKPHYKPDGWLGIIASGKIYVDFAKIEFNLAYEKLKNEISQHRHQHTSQPTIKTKEKNHQDIPSTIPIPVEEASKSGEQYSIV
ncbi:unnamed protein product [Rotaria socialis]|uniref:TIR domain-containing protein n=4 Tax=Rotaria socialis TaxID=392032 RepID=A0A818F3L2_9BILA|nr:unnamed protein product [Rotaria socialis]CAF4851891.1 unnamed protein product [Rotaria socialis]